MDKTIMQKIKALWQRSDFAFLAMIGAAVLVLFGVIFVPPFSCWVVGLLGDEKKQEVIKFIGWGIAGILAFFGAIAVNRRADAQVRSAEAQGEAAKAQSKAAEIQSESNKLIERGHIQERFKAAVEHLGSDKASARISSFYEFSYLARDNEDLRKNIFDILCAHLRQTTADKKYKEEVGVNNEGENLGVKPTEEVQSLLDVLFQKGSQEKLIFAELRPDLREIFLVGARLPAANLWGASMYRADLRSAILFGANLKFSKLHSVDFRNANLREADLQGANLWEADLRGADLHGACLQETILWSANLERAILIGVNFQEARLQCVHLQKANLYSADLQGADLGGADLRGADLRGVENLETANLSGARIKGAMFPEGYEPPADAIVEDDEDDS